MKKTLFAWVGLADLRATKKDGDSELGPIAQVALTNEYSRIVLLDNYAGREDVVGYIGWLKGKCTSELIRREVVLRSPVDYADIYCVAEAEVRSELSNSGPNVIPVFHLSPGTPAMASVWVLLGKARFQGAELVRSSIEAGVETVNIPFEISAEFFPAVTKAADKYLTELTEGLPPEAPEFNDIQKTSKSGEMQKLIARARSVALRDVPVLIEGKTGTGKELFARAIHETSSRKNYEFISVNCGAIPEGLIESEFFGHKKGAFTGADRDRAGHFELANGGTLFLDEIGELPINAQAKILRVLNCDNKKNGINNFKIVRVGESVERSVDVRIIAATNRSLLDEVANGNFRSDLFYRLAVAILVLPPLKERHGDLGLMIESMLEQVNRELARGGNYINKKFSTGAKRLMLQHTWPGNARELINTIRRICIWCPDRIIQEIDVRDAIFPSKAKENSEILNRPLGEGFDLNKVLEEVEAHYILRAIEYSSGKKVKAAEVLGMNNYQTLSNRMRKLGLKD